MTGGPDAGFLEPPEPGPEAQRLYDEDVQDVGYVMNLTRLWAHLPPAQPALARLMGDAAAAAGLSPREKGILVAACASTLRDSYCALAWGNRLAAEAGPDVSAGVLLGDDSALTLPERALAGWARQVARDPNATRRDDVQALRDAGYDEQQIFAVTLFVSLRMAFSAVNDALGAQPDQQLVEQAADPVLAAVSFGRPPAEPRRDARLPPVE